MFSSYRLGTKGPDWHRFRPVLRLSAAEQRDPWPDASWVRKERLGDFNDPELEKFGHLCPDFVAEVLSPSETLRELKEKMAEYMANGAQLGWLMDPYKSRVYIYRPGQAVQSLKNPATISGDPVLPGFVFNVAEIFLAH